MHLVLLVVPDASYDVNEAKLQPFWLATAPFRAEMVDCNLLYNVALKLSIMYVDAQRQFRICRCRVIIDDFTLLTCLVIRHVR